MPIWVIIYLVAFTLIFVNGIRTNIKTFPAHQLFGDIANDLIILFLGCTYWYPVLDKRLHSSATLLLIASLLWLPYSIYFNNRNTVPTTEPSKSCHICQVVLISLFITVVIAPLYYWAILHIAFNEHAGS